MIQIKALRNNSFYLIIGILVILSMVYISKILDLQTIGGWIREIDNSMDSMGIWAPFTIFALRSISIIIPILPGTYCSILSGYFFGFQEGLLIIFLADFIACSSSFFLSRKFGRDFIKRLVGISLMNRVENFSKKHLEQNFFLMTSFLMSNLFDFVCYGIGLTKVPWRKFMPALLFSILISDAPFVASGYAFKQLENIDIQEILNGNINSLQGTPLIVFVISITLIFTLAIINLLLQKNNSIVKKNF